MPIDEHEQELKQAVQNYLDPCKRLVEAGKWHLEDRNLPTMTVLGLTYEDLAEYLLALNVEDYCKKGPDRDTGKPGDLWFFLFDEPGSILDYYVKLKLHPIHLTVLSFHPPESHIKRRFR